MTQTFTWGEHRSMMARFEKEERERGYAQSSSESRLSPSALKALLQREALAWASEGQREAFLRGYVVTIVFVVE